MDAQLLSVSINFFQRHIRTDAETVDRMRSNSAFAMFSERRYHDKQDINGIFRESLEDASVVHVASFILSLMHQGLFGVHTFVAAIIYLSRFKEATEVSLHRMNWRPLFVIALLVADKSWEDRPVKNSCLSKLFPVFSNEELNSLEYFFLRSISFRVLISSEVFGAFKDKLLQEQVSGEIASLVNRSEFVASLQENIPPKTSKVSQNVSPLSTNGSASSYSYPYSMPTTPSFKVPVSLPRQQPVFYPRHGTPLAVNGGTPVIGRMRLNVTAPITFTAPVLNPLPRAAPFSPQINPFVVRAPSIPRVQPLNLGPAIKSNIRSFSPAVIPFGIMRQPGAAVRAFTPVAFR